MRLRVETNTHSSLAVLPTQFFWIFWNRDLFLETNFVDSNVSCNISNRRDSVSSHCQTLRRELKYDAQRSRKHKITIPFFVLECGRRQRITWLQKSYCPSNENMWFMLKNEHKTKRATYINRTLASWKR